MSCRGGGKTKVFVDERMIVGRNCRTYSPQCGVNTQGEGGSRREETKKSQKKNTHTHTKRRHGLLLLLLRRFLV